MQTKSLGLLKTQSMKCHEVHTCCFHCMLNKKHRQKVKAVKVKENKILEKNNLLGGILNL